MNWIIWSARCWPFVASWELWMEFWTRRPSSPLSNPSASSLPVISTHAKIIVVVNHRIYSHFLCAHGMSSSLCIVPCRCSRTIYADKKKIRGNSWNLQQVVNTCIKRIPSRYALVQFFLSTGGTTCLDSNHESRKPDEIDIHVSLDWVLCRWEARRHKWISFQQLFGRFWPARCPISHGTAF